MFVVGFGFKVGGTLTTLFTSYNHRNRGETSLEQGYKGASPPGSNGRGLVVGSSDKLHTCKVVRARGLEPPPLSGPDPKSGASAIPPRAQAAFSLNYRDNHYGLERQNGKFFAAHFRVNSARYLLFGNVPLLSQRFRASLLAAGKCSDLFRAGMGQAHVLLFRQ